MMNKQATIAVRFIGNDDPLALRHGRVYRALRGQKGMICVIDETGEEYAYPPELFEVIETAAADPDPGVMTGQTQLVG